MIGWGSAAWKSGSNGRKSESSCAVGLFLVREAVVLHACMVLSMPSQSELVPASISSTSSRLTDPIIDIYLLPHLIEIHSLGIGYSLSMDFYPLCVLSVFA